MFLQQNKALIYGQDPIEVPETNALIDLGGDDGEISMIKLFNVEKLFTPDKKGIRRPDLKLVCYHISYSAQLVAFFFIQRNKDKQHGLYASQCSQSGVEFMVVKPIS